MFSVTPTFNTVSFDSFWTVLEKSNLFVFGRPLGPRVLDRNKRLRMCALELLDQVFCVTGKKGLFLSVSLSRGILMLPLSLQEGSL